MTTGIEDEALARSEMPVSTTFHDLVTALAAKLDETRRCEAGERHARLEGKHDIASMFARIASRDRHSVEELMQSVQAHQPEERVQPMSAGDR